MKKHLSIVYGACVCAAVVNAHADCPTNTVININAAVSGDPLSYSGTPVIVNFVAGVYRSTLINPGIDSRASFTDWFPFENHALAEITGYTVVSQNTNGNRTALMDWSGGSFASLTNTVAYFTNQIGGPLLFGVLDQILYDNAGGISLLIEYVQPIITIQPAIMIGFDTPSGFWFQLQSNTNLTSTNWTNVGVPVQGNCTNYSFFAPTSLSLSMFYRVEIVPSP